MPDLYSWTVYYRDGTTLAEHDGERVHVFADVNTWHVKAIELRQHVDIAPAPLPDVIITLQPGQRPIFFRRRTLVLPQDGSPQYHDPEITCAGWQQTVGGRNVKCMTWIHPDGSIAVTDRDLMELERG